MIIVSVKRKHHMLCGMKVTGHAGYATPGDDVVCAAVSALSQTLVNSLEELTVGVVQSLEMRSGHLSFTITPVTEQTELLMQSFLIGIKGVAAASPEFVKIEIGGKNDF